MGKNTNSNANNNNHANQLNSNNTDSETCFSKTIGKALRAYESESEADEAILYVKATYGNEAV